MPYARRQLQTAEAHFAGPLLVFRELYSDEMTSRGATPAPIK